MPFQRVALTDEDRSSYTVKVYGTRGEIEAWVRWFISQELTMDAAQCNPQSLKRAVCKVAGTLQTKNGPMGKRGKVTKIAIPPTAEQFTKACEKLALAVSSLTDSTGNKPRLEQLEKIEVSS